MLNEKILIGSPRFPSHGRSWRPERWNNESIHDQIIMDMNSRRVWEGKEDTDLYINIYIYKSFVNHFDSKREWLSMIIRENGLIKIRKKS